jgi:hypothetical protein
MEVVSRKIAAVDVTTPLTDRTRLLFLQIMGEQLPDLISRFLEFATLRRIYDYETIQAPRFPADIGQFRLFAFVILPGFWIPLHGRRRKIIQLLRFRLIPNPKVYSTQSSAISLQMLDRSCNFQTLTQPCANEPKNYSLNRLTDPSPPPSNLCTPFSPVIFAAVLSCQRHSCRLWLITASNPTKNPATSRVLQVLLHSIHYEPSAPRSRWRLSCMCPYRQCCRDRRRVGGWNMACISIANPLINEYS